MNPHDRLVAILRERSVMRRRIVLASGQESDFYVDARRTTLSPEGAVLVAGLILERLKPEAVAVGGPITGADPIIGAVVALSWARGRPVYGFMVRKEPKRHGTGQVIEGLGNLGAGAAVCMVEDTVTTGTSLLRAIRRVEAAGLRVVQCVVVVDREEGARQRLAEAGYPLDALVTRAELE